MKFIERLNQWEKDKAAYRSKFLLDPYFIAEIGVNHEGSIKNAKAIIKEAFENGANAVKFQSYKADRLTSIESPAYWDTNSESTQSQYELFKKYDVLNTEDYFELKKYSDELGIEFLTTPFDDSFVDELDEILEFYKVASADLTNYLLLKKIASKNKPIIISTGASTKEEIDSTLEFLSGFNVPIILNHCILSYPTDIKNANIGMIEDLCNSYPENIIGYSDHTPPSSNFFVQIFSSLLGASFIEKHFTIDKSLPGNDHYHSFDGKDLKQYKDKLNELKTLYGENIKSVIDIELPARENARRSLVFSSSLKKGTILEEEHFIPKRPGTGIPVNEINKIIGEKLNHDVNKDDFFEYKLIEE